MVASIGIRPPASGTRVSGTETGSEFVAPIKSFRDLEVWRRAMDLSHTVYDLTRQLPDDERFGLVSQLRRSSISVPSNIAEGFGRGSRVDYLRFLRVARGSLYEVETQLLFCVERGLIRNAEKAEQHIQSCGQMLAALIRTLETR